MPSHISPNEAQIAKALTIIHELTISFGNGVDLRLSTGALHDEEWSLHFPGANNPGVGCTLETAQLLLRAASSPSIKIAYSQTQQSST